MPGHPLVAGKFAAGPLLYSHPAKIFVQQFERRNASGTVSSVYTRRPGSDDYEILPAPDDDTSFNGPLVSRFVPFAFFNVMKVNPTTGGGNWLHVARVNLLTRAVEAIFELADLRGEAARLDCAPWTFIHGWVSGLLSVSDDGETLTCTVGLPDPARPDGGIRMRYSVFDLDVRSRKLKHLADTTTSSG